jgi:hypothetical protein
MTASPPVTIKVGGTGGDLRTFTISVLDFLGLNPVLLVIDAEIV